MIEDSLRPPSCSGVDVIRAFAGFRIFGCGEVFRIRLGP